MDNKLRSVNTVVAILLTVRVAVSGFFTLHLAHFAYPIVLYALVLLLGFIWRLWSRWNELHRYKDIILMVSLTVICAYIVADMVYFGFAHEWSIHTLGSGLLCVYRCLLPLCCVGAVWVSAELRKNTKCWRMWINAIILCSLIAVLLMNIGNINQMRTIAYWGVVILGFTNLCVLFVSHFLESMALMKNHK